MKKLATLTLLLALWIASPPARADEPPADAQDAWHFRLTPYVWMAGLNGTVGVLSGLPTVEVDAGFRDILENLDLTVMAQAEARYGRLGYLADVIYLELTDKENTSGPFFGGAKLRAETVVMTFDMFYRVLERDRGFLDLAAGVRIWDIDTTLKLQPGLLAGRKLEEQESWGDPVIGARGSVGLSRSFSFSGAADIGGFQTASALTWQVLGTIDYHPRDWLAIHLAVDYDRGGFAWNVSMSGPILGASLRF